MNTSKGEAYIMSILNKENVPFEREKCFTDLRHKRAFLRYDFYLPVQNVMIEYDGEFHYSQIRGGRNEFLHYKENDRIKNSYCLAHNIPLYRIPYWELKNIAQVSDLFQDRFLVKSKWHSDYLTPPDKK